MNDSSINLGDNQLNGVDSEIDELNHAFEGLAAIPADPPSKRQLCDNCCRPKVVCWCPFLPVNLKMKSKVYILQHPNEEKRCLRTARILELGCPQGHCEVIKGKKFSANKHHQIKQLLEDDLTLILFPNTSAVQIDDIPKNLPYNLVLIDGTWSQARSMYFNSPDLHSLKKVVINVGRPSNYVIRTQPNESCLSTVESAAQALAHLEGNPSLYEELTRPLTALCSFQLEHGAVHHYSKEYLVVNGLYDKPVTRKLRKKMGKIREIKKTLS